MERDAKRDSSCERIFLSHISEDGRKQSIEEHLNGTASICADFASAFDAGEQGKFIGQLHDIGKYSDEFQQRLFGGPKVDHSTAGALESAKIGADWAAVCIAGHHSGLLDGGNLKTDQPGDPTFYGRLKKGIADKIPDYAKNWKGSIPEVNNFQNWGKDSVTDSFLIRMLYSCLVDADYLDTEKFMKDGQTGRNVCDSISDLLERLNQYISPWWKPKNELNRWRCDILKSCIDKASEEKGLFTLTVPTGGGKTVASMAFALNHAKEHGMSRVIYVIPYTSIIEQNATIFRDIFGEENVIEHHFGASFDMEENTTPKSQHQALAAENWDAPIIVTTAVQFFESLYANRSSKCRKLHNIANSVLVFDEAQMMPTAHLRPCVAAIANLVEHFGVTAVLCTATQPVLDDLLGEYTTKSPSREICPNVEDLYQKFRRVTFQNVGKLNFSDLTERLSALHQVLCIVNTRKEAQKLYEALTREGSFHLSTLMVPMHRRKVLEEIRERLLAGLPCRVVSTSLIEAGVDVDFPAVYRELAGLDSILQAAGRCNREGKHPAEESIVTVFEGEVPTPPLFQVSIGATKETLFDDPDVSAPETIQRYFSNYRSLAGKTLDKYGIIKAFQEGISGCVFPFKQVAENFHLIDSETKTVYVPVGKGAELIARLKSGECSKALYRKIGQYGVDVYDNHYKELLSAGDIEPLNEDSAVLVNMDLYNTETGLSLHADTGKGLFI